MNFKLVLVISAARTHVWRARLIAATAPQFRWFLARDSSSCSWNATAPLFSSIMMMIIPLPTLPTPWDGTILMERPNCGLLNWWTEQSLFLLIKKLLKKRNFLQFYDYWTQPLCGWRKMPFQNDETYRHQTDRIFFASMYQLAQKKQNLVKYY